MALLFDTERHVVAKHLRNVVQGGELEEKAMCKKCTFPVQINYNLDAILSVGYRVNRKRGTQFCIRAGQD